MDRTQFPAVSRAAGFALLKPAETPRLDPARIATLSGTIAVNLLAFGLLMLPLSMPPPALPVETDHDPDIVWHKREKPVEPVRVEVVQPPRPEIRPAVVPPATIQPPVLQPATPVLTEGGSELAVAAPDAGEAGPVDIAPPVAGPAPMQLQYALAPPPKYPRNALRRGIGGKVMLQVVVGIDGKPLDVTIATSSGNRELDEAARNQVLRHWSFQPAMRDGRAVQAIGLVPVEFSLQR